MGNTSSDRLDWERDGQGWPHREASRFVAAAGLRWHVQQMGPGDVRGPAAESTAAGPPTHRPRPAQGGRPHHEAPAGQAPGSVRGARSAHAAQGGTDADADAAPQDHAGPTAHAEPTADAAHRAHAVPAAQGAPRAHAAPTSPAPCVLLIHGTGASTHSWRGLMPMLAAHFNVVAVDLPGHGFTSMGPAWQMSLPGMSQVLAALLAHIGVAPALVVGHSAGAAIAIRMALDGHIAPAVIVSLNGALLPWGGLPGLLFPPVARLMAAVPFVPQLFSRRAADAAAVQRLIDGTGSTLDADGAELYGRLLRSPAHAAGALAMMAQWDLRPLERELVRLQTQLTLVVGDKDKAVPPSQAQRVKALVPSARLITLHGLGHLAHEEDPVQVARLILKAARTARVLPLDPAA